MAVEAKTTALADVAVQQALFKARRAPRATDVAIRYNNAAKMARVAVAAKAVASTVAVGNGGRYGLMMATGILTPRLRPAEIRSTIPRALITGSARPRESCVAPKTYAGRPPFR
uniref:Uncharacterized protein n=1 Tax=Sipha flava TaxID=143950 RepID=A0A2S2QY36_9HEMI